MTTDRLYYKDVYQTEFQAEVLECREWKNGYSIRLSATAFYPEGGGQPYDTGTLNEAAVREVHERDGEIWHDTDAPLEPGLTVIGKINWARRFDLMQQHSGEHMVSGVIHALYGYDNVGFHMGSDVITIDFNGILEKEDLARVEEQVNNWIWKDLPVRVSFPSPEELAEMPYRSKKELTGSIRIVEFPEVDCCACCGLHVTRTGEIGAVKLLSAEKFRSGVRVEMISGRRVIACLNQIREQNQKISVLLSARPDQTARAVERLSEENFRLKGRLMAAEEKIFHTFAEQLAGRGDVLLLQKGLDPDGVRKLAVAVMEQCGGTCAVFSENEDGSARYAVGKKDGDLREFVRALNETLQGRGGGKPFFAQGSVQAPEEQIRAFFPDFLCVKD